MEYTIADHWNLKEFVALCNNLIAEGWAPQGGVSKAYQSSNSTSYVQAFTRTVA